MARQKRAKGERILVETGCGTLTVSLFKDDGNLKEVLGRMKKSGGCIASQNEAIGRLVSLCLKQDVAALSIIDELKGIRCSSPHPECLSCPDGWAKALLELTTEEVKEVS